MNYKVTLPELGRTIEAPAGRTLLEVLRAAGCAPEAPCGGKGVCGKCRVRVNGAERLACQTVVDGPATVSLPELAKRERILTGGCEQADAEPAEPVGAGLLLAFDIGTTTIAGYLMDEMGAQIATGSRLNPQAPFGSDVITRIQLALRGEQEALTRCVREALADLTCELLNAAKREADALGTICVVGNPCMQQLFLGISPKNLAGVPFAPVLTQTEISRAGDVIALWGDAALLTVPDISGYVGADTVGCVLTTQMDRSDEITLMVDIGTNGEMVMGSRARMVACSTAAGPALEGANIRFGMRAADGAIDHVTVENGEYYGVPYRCLVPLKVENLLVAGRSVSATSEAAGAIRVMPPCMALGQAAGTAAAQAAAAHISPRQIDVQALRDALRRQGAFLG